MSKLSKIIVTILVVVVFLALFAVIGGMSHDAGSKTPGILGLVVLAGAIGAIRAIWKKENNNNDNSILQK